MSTAIRFRAVLLTATLNVLLITVDLGPTQAQLQSGNLHGTVRSSETVTLPGVEVELSGLGAPLVQTTDGLGQFRFLGLPPGSYRLAVGLEGFSPVVIEKVTIAVGRNTDLELTLMSAVDEVITVTDESPLLDVRRISAGATLAQLELEQVPSARDIWAFLHTVPGVLTSDVNVGGNKSGYQQYFSGRGSFQRANAFTMDGMVTTDVAYLNASAGYFDLDSLKEIEVSTGSSDVSMQGGGVTLNMVTKRGTNEWRGSARYLVADHAWQSDLDPDPGGLGAGQEQFAQGDRIVKIAEYGAEGGGPLVRDRLWLWGHYGKNQIDRLTINDVRDFTELENYGAKLNVQANSQNSAVAFIFHDAKTVDGRGAGPTRTQPTTWDQTDSGSPTYKLEDTQMFDSRLFLNVLVSSVDGGFTVTPQGGLDGPNTLLDENLVWQQNFVYGDFDRSQAQARTEGSTFFTTGSVAHELFFGGAYRRAETDEVVRWPGDVVRLDFYRSLGAPHNRARINRRELYAFTTEFTGLFVQDTLRKGRLTANVGLRFDRQQGRLEAANVPGVPGFETLPNGEFLMPAVDIKAWRQGFAWEDLVPRLGLTWALGRDRKTLLRASVSRFSTPMHQWYQSMQWPIDPAWAEFYYEDQDADGRVTVDEIIGFEGGPLATNGYDPLARQGLYDVDPAFDAALSDEVILGVEHSLMPELVAGLSATWRNQHGIEEYERLVVENGIERPHLRSDYELAYVRSVTLPDGSSREVEVYRLRDQVTDTGRALATNGDRETDYLGFDLTLHKRLSKRWMLRGHVTWSKWTWDVPESEREEPNLRCESYPGEAFGGRFGLGAGWNDDGGPVYQHPITPGWSYRLGGLLQVAPDKGWGFDVSANVWGREGYAIPYFTQEHGIFESEPRLDLQAVRPLDTYRLPDLNLVDLRIEKALRFGDLEAAVAIECFNVLNRSTVLARNTQLEISTTNWVQEVVSPRIFRLNLRLRFR